MIIKSIKDSTTLADFKKWNNLSLSEKVRIKRLLNQYGINDAIQR